MIGLDSPIWNDLEDAYGSAEGVPGLLKRLYANPHDRAAWNDAWSRLCHQGTIYSASIAAVPHLVLIATDLPLTERLDPLILVGSIAARVGRPPEKIQADDEFTKFCSDALRLLVEAVEHGTLTEVELRYSLGSVAALLGNNKLADVLYSLDLPVECPKCGNEFEPMELQM